MKIIKLLISLAACIAFLTCKLGIVLAADTNTPPAPATFNTNYFSKVIRWNLQQNFPDAPRNQISIWSDYIAIKAAAKGTDFSNINAELQTTLTNMPWMTNATDKANIPPIATRIALQAMSQPAKSPDVWGTVWLWTGAKLQNSYDAQTLKPNSTSNPYLEINLNERYVMRSGEKWDDIGLPWFGSYHGDSPADSRAHFVHFWEKVPDIEGTFGYVFTSGGPATNISTVVGSSDIYGEATMGLPLIRYCSKDFSWKQQLTAEFSGGFATDKRLLDVHPNVFAGFGYQGKFPNFINTTNTPIYWFGRLGAAMIDRPVIQSGSVQTNGFGPKFQGRWVPSFGTSVVIPVTPALSLQAGGNAYISRSPADWNISLGVTLDLSKFAKGLGTALGVQ